jgi:phosphate transport system permease protein
VNSIPKNYRWRKFVDQVMRGSTVFATGCAVIPLVAIIAYVLTLGSAALSADFFTQVYVPPGTVETSDTPADATAPTFDPEDPFAGVGLDTVAEYDGSQPAAPDANANPDDLFAGIGFSETVTGEGVTTNEAEIYNAGPQGGVLHGIIGTLIIAGLGLVMALPIGIFAGIYLSEYRMQRFATIVRFCVDVLSGSPSIIAGVVIYVLVVIPTQRFSAIAGSMALAILMIPIVTRTTEEMLKLVPDSMREAARGLGAPTWYSTFTVVLPAALPGIVTGVMLAFARGAGETAPLILTVLGSNIISTALLEPMASLPLLTYRYTESPYPGENTLAWGAAFVLMMLVLIMNVLVRVATRNRAGAGR